MNMPPEIRITESDTQDIKELSGTLVAFANAEGKLSPAARKLDSAARKALTRLVESDEWAEVDAGCAVRLAFPTGLAAQAVLLVKLEKTADQARARKAGAAIARAAAKGAVTIFADGQKRPEQIALGVALGAYKFDAHKTGDKPSRGAVEMRVKDAETVAAESGDLAALAEGIYFTRDLVNEPANVLTTEDFAARLAAMQEIGLDVEILEESELEKLGMRLLLSVGQGSAMPSKVVVMHWNGGGDEAPVALVGKGVVFDSGGISIKPAAGMEEMTGDMGGAGTVAGTMRALALGKVAANVVGLVGLVENMPSSKAMRPGDIVASMKGDTVEIINTDAEGRLVLADVLWFAQERFNPRVIVDLATLTGAAVVALGHENSAVFSNREPLSDAFVKAAKAEGEGAWPMPMGPGYDKQIKSEKADMKNVGGRAGGSITAAQFLGRFIREDQPWMHLDIAGTAWGEATDLAPKGARGWGVMALTRWIRDGAKGARD